MSTKKTEKTNGNKSGGEKNEEPTVATTGREHAIAKARPTAVTGAPKDKPVAVIVGGTPAPVTAKAKPAEQPPEGSEIVVFAFRLSRAERDEIHAATGSAKASRFVRSIVLAGARGDSKAVQELIAEAQTSRR